MSSGAREASAASRPSLAFSLFCIGAIAVGLMTPEMALGLSFTDSFWFNIAWTEQFRQAFGWDNLYPRWLPGSWQGLGSPTFYFYPPVFFWLASLADAATFGQLSTSLVATLASTFFLAASGFAMFAWLSEQVGRRASLIGAIAYMVAPYHLGDIYLRGALAEASAYAFLPLIMLSLARIARGQISYLPLLAFSYAALILSHLPSALLASVSAIPAYAFFRAFRSDRPTWRVLALAAVGGILGLALAALYLVPALALTRFISSEALFGPFFNPANWFFWRSWPWEIGIMHMLLPMWVGALLLTIAAGLRRRPEAERAELFFWCGISGFTLIMISGALPFLWELPFLSRVQFPWRMLVITEFAVVTAVAIGAPPLRNAIGYSAAVAVALAYVVSLPGVRVRMQDAWRYGPAASASIRTELRDAPEYLPPGKQIPLGKGGIPDPDRVTLPQVPEARALGAAVLKARRTADGGMRLQVAAAGPVTIVTRRFYFPHWRVLDGEGRELSSGPATPDRLLSWRAPAGRSSFIVRQDSAPGERWGLLISAAALALLLLLVAFLIFRRRMVSEMFTFRR